MRCTNTPTEKHVDNRNSMMALQITVARNDENENQLRPGTATKQQNTMTTAKRSDARQITVQPVAARHIAGLKLKTTHRKPTKTATRTEKHNFQQQIYRTLSIFLWYVPSERAALPRSTLATAFDQTEQNNSKDENMLHRADNAKTTMNMTTIEEQKKIYGVGDVDVCLGLHLQTRTNNKINNSKTQRSTAEQSGAD